ncbi:MAG: hypothetical protein GX060_04095 [Firmicutes bacterium]|nr:hypothetical protein [Bacillota bacterium]
MFRRKSPWIIAICSIATAGFLYLNQCFFFTPLSHRRYAAAHLPWTWYKNPLQVEYGVLAADGWKFTKVTDKAEIKMVFAELSRAAQQTVKPPAVSAESGRQVWFGVRRLSDGAILLSAEGVESEPYFEIKGLAAVYLTPELQALLASRLQQAQE